ncbi:MAG: baseplate J/gp47 family protein [Microbacteriaceae bacterium]
MALNPNILFQQLIRSMSPAYVEASFYKVYATLGIDTSAWEAGHWMGALTRGVSVVLASLSAFQAEACKSQYLRYAKKGWLTLLAYDEYNVERILATQASGTLTLINAGGASYSYDSGDVTFAHETTGANYRNSEAFTLGPNSTLDIPILATEAGSASNASATKITLLVTPIASVTCSNASSVIGQDEEPDEDLRERCKNAKGYWSAANPHGAYEAAVRDARRTTDGTLIGVTRAKAVPDGFGHVTVYCATSNGDALSGTDLAYISTWIQQSIEPQGVDATAAAAVAKTVAVSCTIFSEGDSAEVRQEALDALADLSAIQKVGGTAGFLFEDMVRSTILKSHPGNYHVSMSSPSGDTVIAPTEFPRITVNSADITVTS